MKSRLSTALQVLLWLPRYVNYLPHRKFGVTVLVLGVICITGAAVTASSAPDTPRRGAFAGFFVFLFIGVFPLFLGNVWDIGKHLDERLLPSDRKNPFRENIIELVRLNRQLHGIGGKEANAQRAVLESEIGRLREWPYQQSYETNKALAEGFVAETQFDRDLTQLTASEKREEYDAIAREVQRMLSGRMKRRRL